MRTIIIALLLVAGCSSGSSFDQQRWLSADLDGRDRADMLPDLLQRHPLIGMSRQQVLGLLGPPSDRSFLGADMVYVLGNDGSMFAIDHEWLFIKLDRNDRVLSYERGTD